MSQVEVQSDDQFMSLKVMRLTSPSLEIKTGIYNEVPLVKNSTPFLSGFESADPGPLANFDLKPILSVPSSIETIYLGETFSSYLCVNNETEAILQHMTLKVELQATYRHFSLIDTTITPQDIKPLKAAQYIVHHEVKELGMHFLLCSVHYLAPNKERKFFKKIYKVNVLNPLAVKTKANNLRIGGVVLLEVQIQNLSTTNMFLENMRFEPVNIFNYQDLNYVFEENTKEPIRTNVLENVELSPSSLKSISMDAMTEADSTAACYDPSPRFPTPIESEEVSSDNSITSQDENNDKTAKAAEISPDTTELENQPTSEVEEKKQESATQEPLNETLTSAESKIKTPIINIISDEKEKEPTKTELKSSTPENQPSTPNSNSEKVTTLDNSIIYSETDRKGIFGDFNYLKPNEVRQYLYKLSPKEINKNEAFITNELGKLDIVWRSSFCGMGRLQTSQLTRRPPLLEMIELRVVSLPDKIILETPFSIKCRIQNRTKEPMHIEIATDRTKLGSILFCGLSPLNLGPITAGYSFTFEMKYLPLTPGPHKLGGLKVTDLISKSSHEVEILTEVFVHHH